MRADLHTHSNASDGELTPADLAVLETAAETIWWAITDHDTLDGFDALPASSLPQTSPRLIPGIELSTLWSGREIHVVGLNFDPGHAIVREAVTAQQRRRAERAERIAERLEQLGIHGALDGARRIAGASHLGRPHFAQFLVQSGRVGSVEDAFRRYLGNGKPAAVSFAWPEIREAIGWIRESGGIAVLAHPLAYEFTRTRLRALANAFIDAGGAGIEVALAGMTPDQIRAIAGLAQEKSLLASSGSDFHTLSQPWRLPSRIPPLPDFLTPVWKSWSDRATSYG